MTFSRPNNDDVCLSIIGLTNIVLWSNWEIELLVKALLYENNVGWNDDITYGLQIQSSYENSYVNLKNCPSTMYVYLPS